MSVVCQNVATLTTATVVTTSTVYVSTVFSQGVGVPSTVTRVVSSATCSTHVVSNVTSESCATMVMTSYQVITGTAPQVQVPVTVTSQIVQTQFNTLFGTVCNTVSTPVQPSSQPPSPQPTTPPVPAVTDTTYTTQFVTITGSPPPVPTSTSSTSFTSTSSVSRNTVYGTLTSSSLTGEPDPSNTPIGAVSSPTSSSNSTPVGAIAGGVVGGVVLLGLLGSLAYFLIFKKSIFSPKGYQRPVGEDINDQHGGNGQSGWYPQMQDQGGYHTYGDGSGYGQQLQGSSMSTPPPQYTGQLQPQDFNGQNLYADTQVAGQGPGAQFWQQNMASSAGVKGFSAAALPAGAAAAVVVSHSPHSSTSSTGRPGSHISTTPLLVSGSRHRQQPSQGSFIVPYRGYAEPVDDS